MNESIYEYISDHVNEKGELPKGISLPKEREIDEAVYWDGEIDGMITFHEMPFDKDISTLKKVLSLASSRDTAEASGLLEGYFQDSKHRMLSLYNNFRSFVISEQQRLVPDALFEFAASTLVSSGNPECVKLALSLMELLDTDDNDAVREAVMTLGLSDELTLFSVFVAETWKDGNDAILALAKKTHGFGRIQAIEHLDATKGRVKDWLFREGVNNTISGSYSAYTVAEKIDFLKVLGNPAFEAVDYHFAAPIMEGLLNEESLLGISKLANRTELLEAYLKQAEKYPQNEYTLMVLCGIHDYTENKIFTRSGAIGERCAKLLGSQDVRDTLDKLLSEGRGFRIAERLKLDCTEEVLTCLDADFYKYYEYMDLAAKNEAALDRLLTLVSEKLDLAAIATGPEDNLGTDHEKYRPCFALSYLMTVLEPYPGKGENFISEALQAPINATRAQALHTLSTWLQTKTYKPSVTIRTAIEKLHATEVNSDNRVLLDSLNI